MNKHLDLNLEIKAAPDDEGVFEGIASPFGGSPDSYGDVVDPGAYAETLAHHKRRGTMPLMLWGHNPDEPIGVWEELAENGSGLIGKGRLLRGVRKAEEVYIMLKHRAVRGLSIGYRVIESVPEGRVNRLKKLDLMEVSVVAFPAAPRARVTSVKNDKLLDLGERWEGLARSVRDGEPPPIKEFESLLCDAGVPKAMAVRIASVGYAKSFRSDSEGGTANENHAAAFAALAEAARNFSIR